MGDLVLIFVGASLVNNLLLTHLLGVCSGTAVSRKVETALGFGLSTAAVLPLAAAAGYAMSRWVLQPLDLLFLETLSLLLVSCAVVLAAEKVLHAVRPDLHERVAVFVPLVLVNNAVLGIALLAVRHAHGLLSALAHGLGAGVGLALVLAMLAAMEERIAVADIPAPFRGVAVTLITLGLLSMAFMGFSGLDNP